MLCGKEQRPRSWHHRGPKREPTSAPVHGLSHGMRPPQARVSDRSPLPAIGAFTKTANLQTGANTRAITRPEACPEPTAGSLGR
jgi:hypothetical protein